MINSFFTDIIINSFFYIENTDDLLKKNNITLPGKISKLQKMKHNPGDICNQKLINDLDEIRFLDEGMNLIEYIFPPDNLYVNADLLAEKKSIEEKYNKLKTDPCLLKEISKKIFLLSLENKIVSLKKHEKK